MSDKDFSKGMAPVRRKYFSNKVRILCFYLMSMVLSTLNNAKNYCLTGSSKTFDRILLMIPQHIGDFVWTTSIIRTLSIMYPGVTFDVVAYPDNREIASLHHNVRKVFTFTHPRLRVTGKPTGKFDWSNLRNIFKEIQRNEYDGLIILLPETLLNLLVQIFFLIKKRPIKVCDISWLSLLNRLDGDTNKKHVLDIFKQVITPFSKDGKVPELIPFMDVPIANRPWSKPHPNDKRTIGFCIGAAWEYRKWNRAHYLDVANLILQEYKNAIITVYGYDFEDVEAANFIKNNCRYPERIEIFPRSGMIDFLKSLRQCDLVISNDSGPAHISSALAIPLLVIFGPTLPVRDAPRGLSTVKVYWKKMECSPCDQTVCINPVKQKCMNSVLPTEVFEGVKEIIQGFYT